MSISRIMLFIDLWFRMHIEFRKYKYKQNCWYMCWIIILYIYLHSRQTHTHAHAFKNLEFSFSLRRARCHFPGDSIDNMLIVIKHEIINRTWPEIIIQVTVSYGSPPANTCPYNRTTITINNSRALTSVRIWRTKQRLPKQEYVHVDERATTATKTEKPKIKSRIMKINARIHPVA